MMALQSLYTLYYFIRGLLHGDMCPLLLWLHLMMSLGPLALGCSPMKIARGSTWASVGVAA
jgi:hypothetical protein